MSNVRSGGGGLAAAARGRLRSRRIERRTGLAWGCGRGAASINAQILKMGGDTVELVYYPRADELLPGDTLEALESEGSGLILQVIGVSSASYAGAGEAAMQEVLETAATETHHLLNREQGLADLKRMKFATAKIRRRIRGGVWGKLGRLDHRPQRRAATGQRY